MKRPLSGKHVRVYVAYEQAVKVGGVIFTQSTAIILLRLRGVWIKNWFKRRLTAVSAAIFVFDFPWQVWQGIRADIHIQTGTRGVDLADFIYLINSEFEVNITLLKVALLLALALYLFLITRLYRFGNNDVRNGIQISSE